VEEHPPVDSGRRLGMLMVGGGARTSSDDCSQRGGQGSPRGREGGRRSLLNGRQEEVVVGMRMGMVSMGGAVMMVGQRRLRALAMVLVLQLIPKLTVVMSFG
jgi:hypothetical protein